VVNQDGMMNEATFRQALGEQLTALGVPSVEAAMLVGFLDERGFFSALARTVQENGEVFGAYKSLGQGGIPVRVFEAFTGKGSVGMVGDSGSTLQALRRLHQGGMAMAAGTWSAAPGVLASSNWWVGSHAFSVLDFDEATQTVSLRNPWGSHPDPDGFFALSLNEFLRGFESYSYADAHP